MIDTRNQNYSETLSQIVELHDLVSVLEKMYLYNYHKELLTNSALAKTSL